jgi:hypothetical protein
MEGPHVDPAGGCEPHGRRLIFLSQ